jgi:hypothetical protein
MSFVPYVTSTFIYMRQRINNPKPNQSYCLLYVLMLTKLHEKIRYTFSKQFMLAKIWSIAFYFFLFDFLKFFWFARISILVVNCIFCRANIQYCLLLKSNNKTNLFCDVIFLHLAVENLASWPGPARPGGMFFLMVILGGWRLDQLPFRRRFKLVAETQGTLQ